MAQKRKSSGGSSTGTRAQGAGRTSNSEPRIQVFQQFTGVNFEYAPRSYTTSDPQPGESQSNLQMTFVALQDNVITADDKTFETRNNIVTLYDAPDGTKFDEAALLAGEYLYLQTSDRTLYRMRLGNDAMTPVTMDDKTSSNMEPLFKQLCMADDKLIGTTSDGGLWDGGMESGLCESMSNAKPVDDPGPLTFDDLKAMGNLVISEDYIDDECENRISLSYSLVNKYGPTAVSKSLTFFASKPTVDWSTDCYLRVRVDIPTGYDIVAIEFYYDSGESYDLLFAGRTEDIVADSYATFNWMGSMQGVDSWSYSNLIAQEKNYTAGVNASRIAYVDSRIYYWGDAANPYRLYIGGNPGNILSVSLGTGGGYVDTEPGTMQEIRYVDKYKTQSGNSIMTMLCDSPNSSNEARYNLVENTVQVSNEVNGKSWQAERIAGAVGCKSYHGARVCADGLYSVSRFGLALTTLTMEYNSQIRTNYVSSPVKPAFIDRLGEHLSKAMLLEADGVLYLAFGTGVGDEVDNLLFCYDIDLKAWWTESIPIEDGDSIVNLIHIDSESHREGIGILTKRHLYLLPLTQDDSFDTVADFTSLIVTGDLAAQQPQQGWVWLSQLEFVFDRFIGKMDVTLDCIDWFGRKMKVEKHIEHDECVYDLSEWMRVDMRVRSYRLTFRAKANYRMTHFMAKCYTTSNKAAITRGFDDRVSYRASGDIHPTFKDYNDVRKAIFT